MSTTTECEPVTDCRTQGPVEPRQPLGPRTDIPVPVVEVATTVPAIALPVTGGGGLGVAALLVMVAGVVCVLAGKRKQPRRPVEMPGAGL